MTIQIELGPEDEAQLREAAAVEGMDATSYVQKAVLELLRQNTFARPLTESELLSRITRGFPEVFWNRYRELAALRDAGTLTSEEQHELIGMSDQMEARAAERLNYLIELSKRQGVAVRDLMEQLGIRPVPIS